MSTELSYGALVCGVVTSSARLCEISPTIGVTSTFWSSLRQSRRHSTILCTSAFSSKICLIDPSVSSRQHHSAPILARIFYVRLNMPLSIREYFEHIIYLAALVLVA